MSTICCRGAVVALAAVLHSACGNNSGTPPSTTPDAGTTITLTPSGASPRTLTVPRGSQITFINQDTTVHQMYSDPHPEHTDCPEFDSVGQLSPGSRRQTANLVSARTCNFHDHLNFFNASLRGSIVIQ
jgi:plastocyanin